MIDAASHVAAKQVYDNALAEHIKLLKPVQQPEVQALQKPSSDMSFGGVIGKMVDDVATKTKVAAEETNKVMLGQSDNIHQAMIASQESSLAFTMLVEVRNKLVESYQQLMRMPV